MKVLRERGKSFEGFLGADVRTTPYPCLDVYTTQIQQCPQFISPSQKKKKKKSEKAYKRTTLYLGSI